MPPRTIQKDEALDTLRDEMLYLESSLLRDPRTKALASELATIIDEVDKVKQGQAELWRREIQAQAGVGGVNYTLDGLTEDLAEAKVRALRKENPQWKDPDARASSEYRLYIKTTVTDLTRLGLESQMIEMKAFPELLSREADPEVAAFAPKLEEQLKAGREAIDERDRAQAATAEHRAKSIEKLAEKVDDLRLTMYRKLLEIAQQQKLSKKWPDKFYRKTAEPGPNRDEARGRALALLGVLEARKLEVSDEERKKIATNLDAERFVRWTTAAMTCAATRELFVEEAPAAKPTKSKKK